MNRNPCLWALVICTVVPAGAAAQTVYYSTAREIRKLSVGAAGTALVHTSPMPVGDLALCAGNPANPAADAHRYLYFVEHDAVGGDRIGRLDANAPLGKKALVNTTATTVVSVGVATGRIGEIRLTGGCDVLFATSTGVFQVSGTAEFATEATRVARAGGADVVTAAGSGLAVAFDGSLRYSDGTDVKSTLDGFAPAAAAGAIVGLGVANAGAGSAVPSLAALSVGAVCASTANTLKCGSKLGGPLSTTHAAFTVAGSTAVNKAQFFEFLTDDGAVVATSVNPAGGVGSSAEFNGILWKVDGGGVRELTRGAKVKGLWQPIVGVAVGGSSSLAVPVATAAGVTSVVNFGPVAFDVKTPSSCNLAITLQQLSWSDARARLASANTTAGYEKYGLDAGLGGESWIDDVAVHVTSGTCDLSLAPATVGIAQFVDNGPNRAVLHCDGPSCEVATEGNFPYSTPDDERDSALPDNFSDFLTATIGPASPSALPAIVLSSPLSTEAVVAGTIDATEIAAASTHNASSGVAVRFRICANADCTEFAPGEEPDPPARGAGLSLTRLRDDGVPLADCDLDDQGGANPDRPVFRVSEGGSHVFNLNTPPGGPAACTLQDVPDGQRALFVATVFSHGGLFRKTSVLFWLTK